MSNGQMATTRPAKQYNALYELSTLQNMAPLLLRRKGTLRPDVWEHALGVWEHASHIDNPSVTREIPKPRLVEP